MLLTIPSLALSCATLVVVGGLYIDSQAAFKAERDKLDKLSELVIATSRTIRNENAASNSELIVRFSDMANSMADRIADLGKRPREAGKPTAKKTASR